MYKKTIAMALALMLAFAGCALADQAAEPGVFLIANGTKADINGDGYEETISFTTTADANGNEKYALSVDAMSVEGEGCSLSGELYLARLDEGRKEAILLVYEYGPSDDDCCYAYLYDGEALNYIGVIPSAPSSMRVSGQVIECVVRGMVLQTWFRPAEYAVARGGQWDEDGHYAVKAPVIYQVPRGYYPMGTLAALKCELPLCKSPSDSAIAVTLSAGEGVIVAATDDVEWVYVISAEPNYEREANEGWVRLSGVYGLNVLINGEEVDGANVFDGLLYAD